jgi:hypothetical protein
MNQALIHKEKFMSESRTEYEVTFIDSNTANSIYNIFSNYNYDLSKETQFKKEIDAFSEMGLDGSKAFDSDNDGYELSSLRLDSLKLEFTVSSGSWFPYNIFSLLSDITDIEILMVEDDNGTGDVCVQYIKDDHAIQYCTGGNGVYDEILFENKSEPDFLKLVGDLIDSGKLV